MKICRRCMKLHKKLYTAYCEPCDKQVKLDKWIRSEWKRAEEEGKNGRPVIGLFQ